MKGNAAKFRGGQQRIQRHLLRMADKGAVSLKHLGCATRFAFKGITRDMRGTHVHLIQQGDVEIRLWFPDVQHDAKLLSFVETCQQRRVIHHRSPAGIYQNSASLQTADQLFVGQVQSLVRPLFKERRMEGDDVALVDQLIQRAEVAFIAVILTRRIAQQGADTPGFQTLLQTSAHVAHPHNPDGAVFQRKTIALGQHQ